MAARKAVEPFIQQGLQWTGIDPRFFANRSSPFPGAHAGDRRLQYRMQP
jgi:hypothetical protein